MRFNDTLADLPLFQGMSDSELKDVVAEVKFDFATYSNKRIIVDEGMPIKRLLFLIDGEVEVMRNYDGFNVTERISAPAVIQPERLFGMHQHYTYRFIAVRRVSVLSVSKHDVTEMMSRYLVFRINVLNLISSLCQYRDDENANINRRNARERIIFFLKNHVFRPTGRKVFRIKMQQLADILNYNRLEISEELNRMDAEGIIILQRGMITIPQIFDL